VEMTPAGDAWAEERDRRWSAISWRSFVTQFGRSPAAVSLISRTTTSSITGPGSAWRSAMGGQSTCGEINHEGPVE